MIIKNRIRNYVVLLLIGLAGKILSISAVPIDVTHSNGNDEKFNYTQLLSKLYDEHSEIKMFEDRFFNHTKYPFINDCFVKDIHTNQIILCLNYFDMVERLSLSQSINRDIKSNYFQEQLKSLDYQYENKINEFCDNLKSYLPQTQRFNQIKEIENYFIPFRSNNIFCIKYCVIDTYTATKTSELINDMCKLILSGNELLNQHDKVNDQPKIYNPLQLGEMQNMKHPKQNHDNLNQSIQLNSEQSKDISNNFISEKKDIVTEKLASSLNSVKTNNESTVKPIGKSLSDNTELEKVNNLSNKLNSNEKQQMQAQLLPVDPQQDKPVKTDTKSTSKDDGIDEIPKDNDNKNIDNINNNNNNNNNDVSNDDYNVFDRDAKTEISSNEKNTDSELNIADGDIEADDDDDNYANDKPNILPPIPSNTLDEKLKINNNKDINNSNNNNNNNNNNNIDENDERNENNKIIKDPFFEDTESNFTFYFTIFIIFIFLTYFVYHYKNRIIAIALEGRRGNNSLSSRRRKQGAVYKRLDTNLEEAITSNNSNNTGNTSQIIY